MIDREGDSRSRRDIARIGDLAEIGGLRADFQNGQDNETIQNRVTDCIDNLCNDCGNWLQ